MSKPSHKSQQANAGTELTKEADSHLQAFAGQWQLQRKIIQSNGDEFVFEGEATFSWCGSWLNYQESGQVTAPDGRQLSAERTYCWQPGTSQQIDVYFEDGRFFHSFSKDTPQAEHLCGNDHYKVDYVFNQWPVWESYWRVTGPRKDYTMLSRYRPA
ncbi:DUF6314 family protein [Alteromonas sp. ASW11-19]|uniref:DUF6314 family protein n=1 Tax=Alteromonas salexigens TaxID=2982530 RepID=A0ABT2VRW4_9ALTE|nr:DUF6314 family protein [Alteromonas salexigens]MCU7556026.1 DUF6314 family protein [Alteromonas salexigens]